MDKETKYDALMAKIFKLSIESADKLDYAEAYDYGDSDLYECEHISYAKGFYDACNSINDNIAITDKEKKYDLLVQQIKELYLKSTYKLAYAEAYDYGGSDFYECDHINYANGFDDGCNLLVDDDIVITHKEYHAAIKAGRAEAMGEKNPEDGESDKK